LGLKLCSPELGEPQAPDMRQERCRAPLDVLVEIAIELTDHCLRDASA